MHSARPNLNPSTSNISGSDRADVTGASMSPGLAAMTSKAGAAVPFARSAGLLEDLAGSA